MWWNACIAFGLDTYHKHVAHYLLWCWNHLSDHHTISPRAHAKGLPKPGCHAAVLSEMHRQRQGAECTKRYITVQLLPGHQNSYATASHLASCCHGGSPEAMRPTLSEGHDPQVTAATPWNFCSAGCVLVQQYRRLDAASLALVQHRVPVAHLHTCSAGFPTQPRIANLTSLDMYQTT